MELTRRDKGIKRALERGDYFIKEIDYKVVDSKPRITIFMERAEEAEGIRKNITVQYNADHGDTSKLNQIKIECKDENDYFYLPFDDSSYLARLVRHLIMEYKLHALARVNDDTISLNDVAYEYYTFYSDTLKGFIYSAAHNAFYFNMGATFITQYTDETFTAKKVTTILPLAKGSKYKYLGMILDKFTEEELPRAEELLGTIVFKKAIKRYKRFKLKEKIKKTLKIR